MKYKKSSILKIVKKVEGKFPLSPAEIQEISEFEKPNKENDLVTLTKKMGFPLAVVLGLLIAAFSSDFETIASSLPSWTNLPQPASAGLDYIWSIISDPVGKQNIIYHLPNIILYSFGIVGVKKIFDAIDRKTWLDRANNAKEKVADRLINGTIDFSLKKGHSILFVGKGDFIGSQFVSNHNPDNTITVSEIKPTHTNVWSYYNSESGFEDLETVLIRADGSNAGEYIFFPVKDDQIFLPSQKSYDLSPHKLDILCQDIRTIEKNHKWTSKRIIVVGDKYQQSIVFSEDIRKRLRDTKDIISIESISRKYKNILLIDPTEVVLGKIIDIARGRKIVFRATEEGLREYKERFYFRLKKLGYRNTANKKGILTIGYDIFEDQTEQQTLSRIVDDYYPVVLSKTVRDALIRNGYKKDEFLYVPDLVLSVLSIKAAEQ